MIFAIRCNPPKSTHQGSAMIMRRKDGSAFVGKSASSKGARVKADLITLLSPHTPAKPLDGPLALSVRWVYPWRKGEPKRNRALGSMPCDTRPDADNLLKLLCDCMTRCGFWTDDSQIATLRFEKAWGDEPGITVEVFTLWVDCKGGG